VAPGHHVCTEKGCASAKEQQSNSRKFIAMIATKSLETNRNLLHTKECPSSPCKLKDPGACSEKAAGPGWAQATLDVKTAETQGILAGILNKYNNPANNLSSGRSDMGPVGREEHLNGNMLFSLFFVCTT